MIMMTIDVVIDLLGTMMGLMMMKVVEVVVAMAGRINQKLNQTLGLAKRITRCSNQILKNRLIRINDHIAKFVFPQETLIVHLPD